MRRISKESREELKKLYEALKQITEIIKKLQIKKEKTKERFKKRYKKLDEGLKKVKKELKEELQKDVDKQDKEKIAQLKNKINKYNQVKKKTRKFEKEKLQKLDEKINSLKKQQTKIKQLINDIKLNKRKDIAQLVTKLGIGTVKTVGSATIKTLSEAESKKKMIISYAVRKTFNENKEESIDESIKNIGTRSLSSGLKFSLKGMLSVLKISMKLALKSIIKGALAIGLPFALILLLCAFFFLFYSDFSFDFNNGSGGMSSAISAMYDSTEYTNNTYNYMQELITQSISNIVSTPTYNENETTIRTTTVMESLTDTDIDVLTQVLYIGILTNENAYVDGQLKEHFLSGNTSSLTTYLLTENVNIINNSLEKCVKYTETQTETIINNSESVGSNWVNVKGVRDYISPIPTTYKKCIVSSDSIIPLRSLLKINGEYYKVVEKKDIAGNFKIEVINELSDTMVYHFEGYSNTLPTECTDFTRYYKCGGHQENVETRHNDGLLMTQDIFNASACNNYNVVPTRTVIGFSGGGVPIYSDEIINKYICKGHIQTNNYYDFEGYQTYLPVNCANTEIYYECDGQQETQGNVNLEIGNYETYFHIDSSDSNSPQKIVIKDITINADIKTMEEIKNENRNNKDFLGKLQQIEEMKNG